MSDTVAVGGPAPNSPAGHRRRPRRAPRLHPVGVQGPAGGARLLSRPTPVCQLNSYGRHRRVPVGRRPGAGHQPSVGGEPRRFSANQGGFAFPLLADARDGRGQGRPSGRSGSTGRSSWWMREGTVRCVHRAVAGLWFRPTDEVVGRSAARRSGPSGTSSDVAGHPPAAAARSASFRTRVRARHRSRPVAVRLRRHGAARRRRMAGGGGRRAHRSSGGRSPAPGRPAGRPALPAPGAPAGGDGHRACCSRPTPARRSPWRRRPGRRRRGRGCGMRGRRVLAQPRQADDHGRRRCRKDQMERMVQPCPASPGRCDRSTPLTPWRWRCATWPMRRCGSASAPSPAATEAHRVQGGGSRGIGLGPEPMTSAPGSRTDGLGVRAEVTP